MKMINRLVVLFLALALTAGCASGRTSIKASDPAAQQVPKGDDYVIGIDDVLQISVWGQKDLNLSVTVLPDGKISLPLLGDVTAQRKTVAQLREELTKKYTEYVQAPNVTLIVTGTASVRFDKRINVVGEVKSPQMVTFREGMKILDVIQMVGGFSPYASANKTKIVRGEGEKAVEIVVKMKDLMKDGDVTQNVPVQPGDVVVVPESWF
jgi:polysaccharide export outer membrane protein